MILGSLFALGTFGGRLFAFHKALKLSPKVPGS